MNAPRRATRAGRNLLVALLVGAVLIAGMVVAYVAGRGQAPSTEAQTSAVPQPRTTPTGTAPDGAPPTGCSGGEDINNDMLLTSQASAQRTSYGAVEVAAAFFRWTYRSPHPTKKDVAAISPIFVPKAASQSQRSLIADYQRNPNPSAGAVPDGQRISVTTVGGKWLVRALGTGDDQRVSVLAPLVTNDAVSATKTTAEAFDLTWINGRWRIAGIAKASPDELDAGGTTFTAGC